jgi:polysaccharide export outer membrane protein
MGRVARAQSGATRDLSRLVLSPGDAIRIDVWRNKELSGEFPIAADGSITHPLYRELKVAGVPLALVEDEFRTFLTKYESNPAFTLTPLLRVIIAGEVRTPNIMTVPAGTTVAQVIAMAGGPTDRAQLEHVQLVRQSSRQTLDITRPETAAMNIPVNSGDAILIPRRSSIMQDVIAPSSAILAALAGVTSVIIQLNRKP